MLLEHSAERWHHNEGHILARSYGKASLDKSRLLGPVEVKTRRGVFQRKVLYPRGDPNNPITWTDVTDKFMTQSAGILDEQTAREVVRRAKSIEDEGSIRGFAELLGNVPIPT